MSCFFMIKMILQTPILPLLAEKKKGFTPAVVVGVVGLGHVKGIKNNWNKQLNLEEILK